MTRSCATRRALLFSLAVGASRVRAHGAVTWPPPRNAVDSDTAPWSDGVPAPVPFQPWCAFPNASAPDVKDDRNLTGANGQACFWFSNGCAIGCDACDGNTRGPIPRFDPSTGEPLLNFTDAALCAKLGKPKGCLPGAKQPVCDTTRDPPRHVATNCAPGGRTVNTNATCGAAGDVYYFSPWRFPGAAPVLDPCGSAGGRVAGAGGHGNFGAAYVNTSHARASDLGSATLPPRRAAAVTWGAGSAVEVSWNLAANHGGGYSYRLCPASSEPLTEACFQRTPLAFVGRQQLRWGGVGGRTLDFDGTYLAGNTTSPAGSMWAKNPIPRTDSHQVGRTFAPHCAETATQKCSGGGETGLENLEIVDQIFIPEDTPAGDFVLGWRWDCEESNQIWSSCSDVTIWSWNDTARTSAPAARMRSL